VLLQLAPQASQFMILQSHVVAEISDLDNEPLVKMIGGSVHTIVSHDVIGRLMIQVPTTNPVTHESPLIFVVSHDVKRRLIIQLPAINPKIDGTPSIPLSSLAATIDSTQILSSLVS
jgi:hypothetical protein